LSSVKQEPTTRKQNLDEGYRKIRDAYLREEAMYDQTLGPNPAKGPGSATLSLLRVHSHNTRLILEWAKESMDAVEDAIEPTLKRINDFLETYKPLLERLKAEQENMDKKVRELGTR
jgi:hypothetical protein